MTDDGSPNANEIKIYVDGADDGTTATANEAINTLAISNFHIGLALNNLSKWNGLIDEVRVSNTARSACWIAADYNNEMWPNKAVTPSPIPSPNPTSGFYTVGAAVATAVKLISFTAVGLDGAVDLAWQTGSELGNLGFHLYRSSSDSGPWTRITSSLIPGLGSSPLGASYSWRDSGLANGQRYYYRLEDVDTHSVSTFHGPVSAVPLAASVPPGGGSGGSGGSGWLGFGSGPGTLLDLSRLGAVRLRCVVLLFGLLLRGQLFLLLADLPELRRSLLHVPARPLPQLARGGGGACDVGLRGSARGFGLRAGLHPRLRLFCSTPPLPRCPCAAPSWTRWWAVGSSSTRSKPPRC